MFTIKMTSEISASVTDVWEKVNTLRGVNDELAPLLRMTAPKDIYDLPFHQMPAEKPIVASCLLLFGIFPFDLHQLQFDEVWQGGFRENSKSVIHRIWRHHRVISPTNRGCTVTDSVEFEPRLPMFGYFIAHVVRFVFQNRHQYLRHCFASSEGVNS